MDSRFLHKIPDFFQGSRSQNKLQAFQGFQGAVGTLSNLPLTNSGFSVCGIFTFCEEIAWKIIISTKIIFVVKYIYKTFFTQLGLTQGSNV